jgi:peptidoglycan LD-endopeptidase CwlK
MMTVATETAFALRFGFTGPHTFRWEPGVEVTDVNPHIFGDYSAGPMQTLATTARWVIQQQDLPYDRFAIAPVYRARPAPPQAHPLYDPAVNIDIGTAEIKQRLRTTGDDPILGAAAFNAGGLYRSSQNLWHLRSYGDHLDRAAKWYGDACAVLA